MPAKVNPQGGARNHPRKFSLQRLCFVSIVFLRLLPHTKTNKQMLRRYPLLLPLLAFVAGILISGFFRLPLAFIIILIGVATALTLLVVFLKKWRNISFFTFLFLAFGIIFTTLQDHRFLATHYENQTFAPKNIYRGKILSNGVPTKKAVRLEVELQASIGNEKASPLSGKVFLYVPQKLEFQNFRPGDFILFQADLNNIDAPKNPYEFDYLNYLNLNQVYAQSYTDKVFITEKIELSAWRYAANLQQRMRQYISQMNLDAEQESVAQALLLGYKHMLSDDTSRAFSGAGAMHVLAVSGLHVGILYMIVAWLLRINKRKQHKNNFWQVLLTVLIIWGYAFVTGLSPSVVRAATMFSFMALGHLQKRKPASYQSLIISALVLLVYKPNYLFEVGFQLSYAAVFGILYIQPKIYHLIEKPKYWLTNQIWQITAVSIAAQAVTFPLSLYYFHQFPVLFLVSNLIVIPLAWLIMVYGLSLLTLSMFVMPGAWLVAPFKFLLWLMTQSVRFVEGLPHAVLYKLWVNRLELVFITLLVFVLVEVIFNKSKKALFVATGCISILFILDIKDEFLQKDEQKITFYSIKNTPAIEVHTGKEAWLFTTADLLQNEDAMLFHIRHNQWGQGFRLLNHFNIDSTFVAGPIAQHGNIIFFGGDKLLRLTSIADTALLHLNPTFILVHSGVYPPEIKINAKIILMHGHTAGSRQQWQNSQPVFWDLGLYGAYTTHL